MFWSISHVSLFHQVFTLHERHSTNSQIKQLKTTIPASGSLSDALTTEELLDAILCLKPGKSPGIDQILPELLKNIGLTTMQWLRKFLPDCL